MKFKGKIILLCIALAFCTKKGVLWAQEKMISDFFPEIKILESNGPAEGYYFMGSKGLSAPNASHYIAIIDNYGTPVFFRKMDKATGSFNVMKDGRLAYLHGVPRKLYILDDFMNVEQVVNMQGYKPNGHDWDADKLGNILLMGETTRNFDMSSLVEGGQTNAEILDLVVQEFNAEYNLVYTWNSADYFSILDGNENSQYLDFSENQIDYIHTNGISIDSDTSFLLSNRHMDEITKVDRRTGSIIWRLGGKQNQFQFVGDEIGFSHQHSIRALENGNILLFDNGNLHIPQVSSAVEYSIDEQNKTATLIKRFYRKPNVYSNHQGTTQRVYNGNTIINWGPYWPSFTEFHDDGSPALEWDFTTHSFCPRIEKFKWQTSIFEPSQDSVEFGYWENDTLEKTIWLRNNLENTLLITTLETRTNYFGLKTDLPITISPGDSTEAIFWFYPGAAETGFFTDVLTIASDSENERIARQIKVAGKKEDKTAPQVQLVSPNNQVSSSEPIKLKFSEPVSIAGGKDLNYLNVDDFVQFRKNNSLGEDVLKDVIISTDKTLLTIIPQNLLETGSKYYLALNAGLTDYSGNQLDDFETTVSVVLTGVEEKILPEIKIYPNPVSSQLNIQCYSNEKIQSVQIYNVFGRIYWEKEFENNNTVTIETNHFSKGIYLVRVVTQKNKIVKRIIKH